jgi:membrane protein YqaA with SNARE-associated domain
MAEQLVDSLGLTGLFIAAFLAASLLPFPVEAAVPVVVSLGHSTLAIVIVGTLGGYLGSLVNYGLARRGGDWWEQRHPDRVEKISRIRNTFTRWGSPLLILSWLPVIGEGLTLAAGLAEVRLWVFSIWTVMGRALRMYGLVHLSFWLF